MLVNYPSAMKQQSQWSFVENEGQVKTAVTYNVGSMNNSSNANKVRPAVCVPLADMRVLLRGR